VSPGDIILAVDGAPVRTGDDLLGVLEEREIGDTVVVRVLRERSELEVEVVLRRMQ